MKKVYLVVLTIACSLMFIIGCSKSGSSDGDGGGNNNGGFTPDCSGAPKSFANDVNPIIQTFCNQPNCHNTGSGNGPGALTKYIEVFDARARIKPQIAAGLMPQNNTLTAAQKSAIICWIDAGAPNN